MKPQDRPRYVVSVVSEKLDQPRDVNFVRSVIAFSIEVCYYFFFFFLSSTEEPDNLGINAQNTLGQESTAFEVTNAGDEQRINRKR